MFRKSTIVAIATLFLLLPTKLLAGGPPWLCLPIDGVRADNAEACADLLTVKLKSRLHPHQSKVEMHEHANQFYAMLCMEEDMSLRDVESALDGSDFSISRDKLRLFGPVIVEIDALTTQPEGLLADLEALEYVSVAESGLQKDHFVVTLDMPYPADDRPNGQSVGWEKFQRNDLSFDQAARSETPATPKTLPSYAAIRDAVTKHHASVKDIRWSANYACRTLGCVVAPESDVVAAK